MKARKFHSVSHRTFKEWLTSGVIQQKIQPSAVEEIKKLRERILSSFDLSQRELGDLKNLLAMLHTEFNYQEEVKRMMVTPWEPLLCGCKRPELLTRLQTPECEPWILKEYFGLLSYSYLINDIRKRKCSKVDNLSKDLISAGDYICSDCSIMRPTRVCLSGHLLCYACGQFCASCNSKTISIQFQYRKEQQH